MSKKTVLFYRDYQGFTGGHLKVWDYYQHVVSSDCCKGEIYFSKGSKWVDNPWLDIRQQCLLNWVPENADLLFLAGMDWLQLSKKQRENPPAPIINLIQGIRHADKNNQLFEFLRYPATRICVSQQVANAISATGIVNGTILVNNNGVDLDSFLKALKRDLKDIPLLLIGSKNPELATRLSENLKEKGVKHLLILGYLPRNKFIEILNRAKAVVFFPLKEEGFYLPALEAMLLESFVICPDCIGNRDFCIDSVTCMRPEYNIRAITKSIFAMLEMGCCEKNKIIANAKKVANKHSLEKERYNFLKVLSNLLQ